MVWNPSLIIISSSLGPGLGPWSWSNSKFMVRVHVVIVDVRKELRSGLGE